MMKMEMEEEMALVQMTVKASIPQVLLWHYEFSFGDTVELHVASNMMGAPKQCHTP